MINNHLISIIIPAYNSEKYIEKCLQSLYAQTYSNYEIIIAYDKKSKDKSLEILKKHHREQNIILDVGEDSSSGDARNRGFKLAKGEFVVFVDADDEVLPDYLENMYQLFSESQDIDVVNCGYMNVTNENIEQKRLNAEKSNNKQEIISRENALKMFVYGELPGVPWAYLIKRKFLLENNIVFPNYSHGDDSVFIANVLDAASSIGICRKQLYLFRQHSASITHSLPDNWETLFLPSQQEISTILDKYSPELKNIYNLRIVYWGIADGVKRYQKYSEFKDKVKQLLTPYGIKKIPIQIEKYSISKRVAIICFNISWRVYFVLHSTYYKLIITVS